MFIMIEVITAGMKFCSWVIAIRLRTKLCSKPEFIVLGKQNGSLLKKWLLFIYVYVCVCLHMRVCHVAHVEVRVQLAEISSLFPQCGSQGSNPRHQVWHQPLPSEPSHHPTNMVLYNKHPNRLTPLTHYSRSHVPSPKSAIAVVTRISISPWPSVTNSLT